MNEYLAELLRKFGYRHEKTEVVKIDTVKHKARYNAVAIKVKDGRVFVAQHLGYSEVDAEKRLVDMLKRP